MLFNRLFHPMFYLKKFRRLDKSAVIWSAMILLYDTMKNKNVIDDCLRGKNDYDR